LGAARCSGLLPEESAGLELLFFGSALLLEQCQAVVEGSAPAPRGAAPLRTEASVTPEERRAVLKAHEGEALPEGYCFDGVSYLDPFGERLKEHPCARELIHAYLEDQNAHIRAREAAEGPAGDAEQPPTLLAAERVTLSDV